MATPPRQSPSRKAPPSTTQSLSRALHSLQRAQEDLAAIDLRKVSTNAGLRDTVRDLRTCVADGVTKATAAIEADAPAPVKRVGRLIG